MTLKITNHEKIIETLPYSATEDNTPSVVYNGTNKKLNILGRTVAKPYIKVCLKSVLSALNDWPFIWLKLRY